MKEKTIKIKADTGDAVCLEKYAKKGRLTPIFEVAKIAIAEDRNVSYLLCCVEADNEWSLGATSWFEEHEICTLDEAKELAASFLPGGERGVI